MRPGQSCTVVCAPGAQRPAGGAADCDARDPATGLIRLRAGVDEAVAVRIDTSDGAPRAIALLEASGAASVEQRLADGSANDWHEDRADNRDAWRSVAALLQPTSVRRHATG